MSLFFNNSPTLHLTSVVVCFRTHGGAIHDKTNPLVVTVPPILWVKALDMLMDRLIVSGVDLSRIAAISGSAQVGKKTMTRNLLITFK